MMKNKMNRFQSICAVNLRMLKRKTRKETSLKLYKFIAVTVLLCLSQTWNLEEERLESNSSTRNETELSKVTQ
jgi:hypothetical protein